MNQLHYGDNLDVLRRDIPTASVDLVYLDPPFNSNRGYNVIFKTHEGAGASAQIEAFDDTWAWGDEAKEQYQELIEGSTLPRVADMARALFKILGTSDLFAYLVMMLPRLVELKRVLKPGGSLYLHCDPAASHYLKLTLDSIFGAGGFRNEIVWRRARAHNDRKIRRFGSVHDTILFYTNGDKWNFNPQYSERDADAPKTHDIYKHTDGKLYRKDNCRAPGDRGPRYEWNGHTHHWRFSPEERDRLIAEGRIVYSKTGMPRVLRPIDPAKGSPLQDVWIDIDPPNSGSDESLGYPTQKPLALLDRIIASSSNPGDVILDPFCGCGTTVEAAQRLKRKWIGIDVTYIAIDLIQKRLAGVFGAELGPIDVRGIPRDIQGAQALFDRNPFDFERWAVSLVDGQPNTKQVADRGIDGIAQFPFATDETGKALVSVKGGKSLNPGFVRDLLGTVNTEGAHIGILILMEPPTRGMTKAAANSGLFAVPLLGRSFPKIQILTIADLFAGKRPNMPTPFVPYIKAKYNALAQLPMQFAAEKPSAEYGESEGAG